MFFFYRPKIDAEEVKELKDVGRFYMVTSPEQDHGHPRAIIAGHKRPGRDDDPRIIEETRRYIRNFDKIAESSKTSR